MRQVYDVNRLEFKGINLKAKSKCEIGAVIVTRGSRKENQRHLFERPARL